MALRNTLRLHQFRGNRLQTAPSADPITLDELKTHLRITGTDEDTYLASLIDEAVQEIEDYSGLALITQAWRLTLDHWPMHGERWWDGVRQGHVNCIYDGAKYASVVLPRYPLIEVTEITVFDESDTSATVNIADTFVVDTQSLRGRLTLRTGATWPIALRRSNAIQIDYSAGYGAAAAAVPSPLKRAVRMMAAALYEHRGDGCTPGDALVISGARAILDRYRSIEV